MTGSSVLKDNAWGRTLGLLKEQEALQGISTLTRSLKNLAIQEALSLPEIPEYG